MKIINYISSCKINKETKTKKRKVEKTKRKQSKEILLGAYPREMKSIYFSDVCIPMFIATLFMVERYENNQSVDEYIKCEILTSECYAAITKTKPYHYGTEVEAELLMLSELITLIK